MNCANLLADLRDGTLLSNLMEEISGKALVHNKKPKMRVHYVENNGKVLNFIKAQGLKLVGIGPEDIVDGNQKLILGLIWTLILLMKSIEVAVVTLNKIYLPG